MPNVDFGYAISRARALDMDRGDRTVADELIARIPELAACLGCGGCTATCTAGALTQFNFRRVHTLVRRGDHAGAYNEMNKCMLCGKCRLVCPRGINTRGVAMLIKRKLGDW